MMYGINLKIYYAHDTNALLMTDDMTKEKEPQAVRRYLDIFRYKMWGDCWSSIRQRKGILGSISGVAAHGKMCI